MKKDISLNVFVFVKQLSVHSLREDNFTNFINIHVWQTKEGKQIIFSLRAQTANQVEVVVFTTNNSIDGATNPSRFGV